MHQTGCKQCQEHAHDNLWEDFGLKAFAKDQVLQVIESSKRADKQQGAQEAAQDGEPL